MSDCLKSKNRDAKNYHTGIEDSLIPLESLDINKPLDFDEFLAAMSKTSFGGRKLGEAADVGDKMFTDKDTLVIMTLAGAMTPAKQGTLICEMIDRGLVHAVISTGALITHGFVEASGMTHFKHNPSMSDDELYDKGYNRIYDTIELEKNLDDTEEIVYKVLGELNPYMTLCSRTVNYHLGKWLAENVQGRGILKSAYQKNVPVYIPSCTDHEMALDLALYNRRRVAEGKNPFRFDPFIDLEHYIELINQAKKIAIFTIGGGAPRNWGQQGPPYLELICGRMPKGKAPTHIKPKKFSYALRICPEPVELGGLSGAPYSETISWGKLEKDAQYAEVPTDATIAWPILIKAIIQRIEKKGVKIEKNFKMDDVMNKVAELMKQYKLDCNAC